MLIILNREKFMTKEQMILSYEVYLVAKQIKKNYVIPSNEGIELGRDPELCEACDGKIRY